MRMRAAGSICVICLTASIPPISGMMMSIVTRSGFSFWYFSTACLPFSASPTTVKPACARISLTIVRMNTASSHTSTVLPTLPPLFEDVLYQRFDVEHVHPSSFNFNDFRGNVRHRLESHTALELIDWHVVDVADIVHQNSSEALGVLHEQNET